MVRRGLYKLTFLCTQNNEEEEKKGITLYSNLIRVKSISKSDYASYLHEYLTYCERQLVCSQT